MKILKLTAENIKRLSAVEITPNGRVVKITGKNASGKTSVLDSIWWAMGGADNVQDKPIRDGQMKARVKLDLGDLLVERRFTQKATTLIVSNRDGAKYTSPQRILDALIGKLSFDPLAFTRMSDKDKFDQLRGIVQLSGDLDQLARDRAKTFETRAAANRIVQSLEGQVQAFNVSDDDPDEIVKSSDLVAQVQAAISRNNENENKRHNLKIMDEGIKIQNQKIEDLETELIRIREYADDLQSRRAGLAAAVDAMTDVDVMALQERLDGIEGLNTKARNKAVWHQKKTELAAARGDADELTMRLGLLDEQKRSIMEEAEFPLPDLSLDEGVVLYKGMPFDQASSAEQLRASMAIAMAANPKFRVIRITDGSLMDSDSMRIIEEMAEKKDFQVWVEMVDESGKIGVVIEDGHVAT